MSGSDVLLLLPLFLEEQKKKKEEEEEDRGPRLRVETTDKPAVDVPRISATDGITHK